MHHGPRDVGEDGGSLARSHVCILDLPGPPKVPKIMAQYPKIESIGSIGSITWAILEVQVDLGIDVHRPTLQPPETDSKARGCLGVREAALKPDLGVERALWRLSWARSVELPLRSAWSRLRSPKDSKQKFTRGVCRREPIGIPPNSEM